MNNNEIKEILIERVYGHIPKKPIHLSIEEKDQYDFAAGAAVYQRQNMILETENGDILLPFYSIIPIKPNKKAAIITINFEDSLPNKFLPAEEIAERGYAIFSICIGDVTDNDANFKSGIYPVLVGSRRKKSAPGKIAMWTYAASLLFDHIKTIDEIDKSAIGVSGHGVCAKAALLTAAINEDISFVISNDALSAFSFIGNDESAEVRMAYERPYLFCRSFADDPLRNEHALLYQLCRGRKILVGCSADDVNSNYNREYKMLLDGTTLCNAAKYSENDLNLNTVPFIFENDDLLFALREGTSYFSRKDWNRYLDFLDKRLK